MATTTPATGPAATAGVSLAPTPPHDPENRVGEQMLDLATGIQEDADRARQALASLSELLRGCSADYAITASCLLQLIEPVRGYVELVADDMLTLLHADGWMVVAQEQAP